jgi:lysophospholipase L1-like esterase
MPDIVIIQLGIVDCAPRLFKRDGVERKLINRLPNIIKKYYIDFVKKNRKRKRNHAWVNSKKFKENIQNYISRSQIIRPKKIIFIEIPIPSSVYLDKNPKAIHSIKKYNSILNELCSKNDICDTINPLTVKKNIQIYDDGYHPNPMGNNLVADLLINELRNVKNN